MKNFLLITFCLTLIFSNITHLSTAGLRVMSAIPSPVVGGPLLTNHGRDVTLTYDVNGNVVNRTSAGYSLIVNAALVASGQGQVGLRVSGSLHHKGTKVSDLSGSTNIQGVGSSFLGVQIPQRLAVISGVAAGSISVNTEDKTGSYTAKGSQQWVSTASTSGTISFETPVFKFSIGGVTTTLSSSEQGAESSFNIGLVKRYHCQGCNEIVNTPDAHKEVCNVKSPDGDQEASCINSPYWNCQPHTHQFPSSTSEESGSQGESGSYQGSNPNNDGGDSNNQNPDPSDDETGGDDPDETSGDNSNNEGTTTAQCKGCTDSYDEANPGHHVARTCYQLGPNGERCTNKIWDCAQPQHQHSW